MFRGISQRPVRAMAVLGRAAATLIAITLLPAIHPTAAEAKIPGQTHCYKGTCHTVKTIAETAALVGHDEAVIASYYDDCRVDRHNTCDLTSSGEVFHPNDADNAASPIYPDGTILLIRYAKNGKSAVVRVNSAGPYIEKRTLDVSRATAAELGFKKRGVAKLDVKVLYAPTAAEARYKKNRHYDAVPGPIGTFASLDAAHAGFRIALAKAATPLNRKSGLTQLATADLMPSEAQALSEGETPADGLRAAARKAFGLTPDARRVAPATLTADALYALMRNAG